MTDDRLNTGRVEVTLRLLWRGDVEPGRRGRGRPPALSVDRVVAAAVALADRHGLAAVTMRSVADHLGSAPMTLYGYVPDKRVLLDLMHDDVLADLALEPWSPRSRWPTRVRAVAEANRGLHEQHPWLTGVGTQRPSLGPGALRKYDHELRAFDGTAVDDADRDAALAFVLAFVDQHARRAQEAVAVSAATGVTDEEWWRSAGPVLAEVLDETRFPVAVRVGTASAQRHGSAWSAAAAWEFGLARVVDGLRPLLAPTEDAS